MGRLVDNALVSPQRLPRFLRVDVVGIEGTPTTSFSLNSRFFRHYSDLFGDRATEPIWWMRVRVVDVRATWANFTYVCHFLPTDVPQVSFESRGSLLSRANWYFPGRLFNATVNVRFNNVGRNWARLGTHT